MIEYILVILVVIYASLYYYFSSTFDYWKTRGVSGPKPVPFYGTTKDVTLGKECQGVYLKNIYLEYKSKPMVGIFEMMIPGLIINDPEIVKTVLIRDFSKFADRVLVSYDKISPLSMHLFRLDSVRWKSLRPKISPIFTSGKLKEMFYLLLESGEHLRNHLEVIVEKGEPIEVRELMSKFTMNVIASCAFGIDTKSLEEEESEFFRVSKEIFRTGIMYLIKAGLRQGFPKMYSIVGGIFNNTRVCKFFTQVTKDSMEYRKRHNFRRHDFIDILVELKKSEKYTDTFLAAQTFVFFAAGYETSSSTMCQALYEMALDQDIQNKLREEIVRTLEKTDGKITYDSIQEMNYLDRIYKEVLRKYPVLPLLMRKSIVDYTFEGTNVTIPKGQNIYVSILGFHYDSDIYPEPEVFDPDRFTDEMINSRNPMHYLPFGSGPRNCIGIRFANNQVKVGLINIILNYRIDVCEKTPIPFEINPNSYVVLVPKRKVYLKFSKLQSGS